MWDILYVIDASTSMGEPVKLQGGEGLTKVEVVKRGMMQVLASSAFPFDSRVGVMGFSAPTKAMGMMVDEKKDMVQKIIPLTNILEIKRDPARFRGSLDTLAIGGATPTGEGLRAAVEQVHEDSEGRKRIKKIILVTDERSNVGPKPETILDARLVRRTIADVVTLGAAVDKKTFEALTARSGGKFTIVYDVPSLVSALNPRIPYTEDVPVNPLLAEAERVASVLKTTSKTDASYQGLAAAAAAVRQRVEVKLQEVISLEGQARADLDLVVSAATSDPKWPTMSMREFADRVWSRGADLEKMQAIEAGCREAIQSLQM